MPAPPEYSQTAVAYFLAHVRGGRDRTTITAADGTPEPPLPHNHPEDNE